MNRFPDHARVAFIGDSITAAGWWIAHVYDHYLRNFPASDIRMFNAGISGGSAKSALMFFEKNIMVYRPTHAVIMLGMNDIGRIDYDINAQGALKKSDSADRLASLKRYEAGMRELIEKLHSLGVSLTLVTPTCFDEYTDHKSLDKIGCDAALEYAGEIVRRLAVEYGCEFVNLHAPLRLLNAMHCMLRPDRVHPLENGHIVMAQLFLYAQGLCAEPALTDFESLPQTLSLLPENRARFEAEEKMRAVWNTEWHLLRGQSKDEAERRAYLQTYQAPTAYFESLRTFYLEYGQKRDELLNREILLCDACAAR